MEIYPNFIKSKIEIPDYQVLIQFDNEVDAGAFVDWWIVNGGEHAFIEWAKSLNDDGTPADHDGHGSDG